MSLCMIEAIAWLIAGYLFDMSQLGLEVKLCRYSSGNDL